MSLADFMASSWCAMFVALARAGGFVACVPTIGVGTEGVRSRIGLTLVLTLVLLPFAHTQVGNIAGADCFDLVLQGLSVGCLLGFAIRALLCGITLAGQLVEQQLGFHLVADPDDETSTTVVSRLYQILTIALFFMFGGHRLVLAGLIDAGTIDGATSSTGDVVQVAVGLVSQACLLAVRIAMPLVLALLTSSVTVAMISRVLPQSSASSIAMPAQVAFGLLLVFLSLAAVIPAVRDELAGALGWLAATN